jgi:hypothetical protein
LHSFWDSGAEQWSEDLDRPLNSTGEAWLANWENIIINQWPAAAFAADLAVKDVYQWAVDSNALASSVAYTAPQAPTIIPADYITLAQKTAVKLVALGGYRLAQIIESIFNPASPNFGRYSELAAIALASTVSQDPAAHALRGGRN